MPPLEQLFALEIEYHRKLRQQAPGTTDTSALHTSYALQSGYEPLLRHIGRVTAEDLDRLSKRLLLASDARDVLAARDAPPVCWAYGRIRPEHADALTLSGPVKKLVPHPVALR